MKNRILLFVPLLIAIALVISVVNAMETPANAVNYASKTTVPQSDTLLQASPSTKQANHLPELNSYIIRLQAPPLAAYEGGIDSFQATNPAVLGTTKLDTTSANSIAYRDYLKQAQANLLDTIGQLNGRAVTPLYQYTTAVNGIALQLSEEEAAQIAKLPDVAGVYRDEWFFPATDTTPEFIGATAVWDGSATGNIPGTKGEGIIVGIIDTGIWPEHPSFEDDGSFPAPPAYWNGTCQRPDDGSTWIFCNDKLIGARHFLTGYISAVGYYNGLFNSTRDDNGHGTHTAGTAAGNENIAATLLGVPRGTVSGIAPRAHVAAYKALGPWGGVTSDLVAAIDTAVADGVDVINYSIGGGSSDPWAEGSAFAFLNARNAGVFVATSAGNSGPGPSTIGSPGDAPWLTTVGASTSNRHFLSDITVSPPLTNPIELYGASVTTGVVNFELVNGADYTDMFGENGRLCLNPFSANTFSANQVVLCERGENARAAKGSNVKAGGAGGVIVANPEIIGLSTDNYTLPAVHVEAPVGNALRTHLEVNGSAMITFTAGQAVLDSDPRVISDMMGGFSSRGPILHGNSNYVKPNVTGPGVQILAGASPQHLGETQLGELFMAIQGTSMSSPHVAGAGALLKALHPDWTPAEIESALMTTANNNHVKEDGTTPADAFDMGAGRIDLFVVSKAGLVLDETQANYLAANPASGGDPAELNIASLANSRCLAECSWTRTVRSTLTETVEWTAVTNAPTGIDITITPAQFEIEPGATQQLTITANVEAYETDGNWTFADFTLEPANGDVPDAYFPLAIKPTDSIMADRIYKEVNAMSGTIDIDIIAQEISDLTLAESGLEIGTAVTETLSGDPTNDDPYDNLNDGTTFYINVTVPANAARLVAETLDSTAVDMDLYMGTGSVPSAATEQCSSTTATPVEYCNVNNPTAGEWWILVQNWLEGSSPPDLATLIYAVVAADNGDLTATGPDSIPALEPFTVEVEWSKASLTPGARIYGAITIGSEAANPDNIGIANLDLHYLGAAHLTLEEAAFDITQATGTIDTYDLTIVNNGDVDLEWQLLEEASQSVLLDVHTSYDTPFTEPAFWGEASNFTTAGFTPGTSVVNTTSHTPTSEISLVLDDGSMENSIGAYGSQFIWLNRFTPNPAVYPFALTDVQVLFGNNVGVNVGESLDIYIYQDLDGDGDPGTGAEFLTALRGVNIQTTDGSTFSTFALNDPLMLQEPGDILIAVVNRGTGITSPEQYPAALDTTTNRSRSWIGLYSTGSPADPPVLPADTNWGLTSSFGLPGNWLIRGLGEQCGTANSVSWLSLTPTAGTTSPNNSSIVQLQIDTTDLEPGQYSANVCLSSNASNLQEAFTRIPVTIEVTEGGYRIYLPAIQK